MSDEARFTYLEHVLLLTAFAAGAVDVTSFFRLGGVFASAMTGNLALLAFYVSRSENAAAMGSVIALSGFVLGCAIGIFLRRGRTRGEALNLLLMTETGLLLFFFICAAWTSSAEHSRSEDFQIALLAIAMGVQAIVGQLISMTSIVFTTTLAALVGTITDSIINGSLARLREVKIQSAVVVSYLFGALLAGAFLVRKTELAYLLPCAGVTAALLLHYRSSQRAE